MAIKTNVQNVTVMADPLSFTSEIKILRGNPVQTLNKSSGEYEADRTVLPCVLMPVVTVSDPENIMSGEVPIAGCEWYEGAPKANKSNLIRNSSEYEISAEGEPDWSLKVRKNFDQAQPCDIYAVFVFIDVRKGISVKVERSVSFRTAYYDYESYSLKIDQPEQWLIDPLTESDTNAPWLHTITAQLYSGIIKVEDKNAAYFWQKYENGVWKDITADDLEVWCSGKTASGWSKSLTFDARYFKQMAFRCRAAYYNGVKPSAPTSSALAVTTNVKVDMPRTLRVGIRRTRGFKVAGTMRTPVGFECVVENKGKVIPKDKYNLLSIIWYAKSGSPGATPYLLGAGRHLDFVPGDVGMDRTYSNAVQAEVNLFHTAALLTFGGKVLSFKNTVITKYKFQ